MKRRRNWISGHVRKCVKIDIITLLDHVSTISTKVRILQKFYQDLPYQFEKFIKVVYSDGKYCEYQSIVHHTCCFTTTDPLLVCKVLDVLKEIDEFHKINPVRVFMRMPSSSMLFHYFYDMSKGEVNYIVQKNELMTKAKWQFLREYHIV